MGSDIFDLVVILFLVFFSLMGWINGFLREIGGIIALVGGFLVANALHPLVSSHLQFIANPTSRTILAYLVIFISFMLLISLIIRLLRKLLDKTFTKWIDHLAGLLFGLAKGILICSLLMVVVQTLFYNTDVVKNSRTIPYLSTIVNQLRTWMPDDLLARLRINN
ncbi:MAG: CvpA family protein [Desulfovibrionaceae bacterium]|nr:CvpA family protein [Desulfovibrionaceae bacterium]